MTDLPARFHLLRHRDVSGISGTGIVAHGVRWPDGTASVRWTGARPSIVHWESMEHAEAVHGHGGATEIVWTDEPETDEQRADREETERDHAQGDHQWCGITCRTVLPSQVLRNGILARAVPGSGAMLTELERRARQEATAPADRTELRDRIAEALAREDGYTWGPGRDSLSSGIIEPYLRTADKVLAVLPADTGQAADRANALREAADALDAQTCECGCRRASEFLRQRAADETQPAATCSAQYHGDDDGARLCIRAAQHTGKAHTDDHGFHWSDTVAVYPLDDGTFRTGTNLRDALRNSATEERP